jgi:bifunctional non-homologous end joining protein LigD
VKTRILSRNQKDLGSKFPEVKDSIAALNIQDAIIGGEIVALDETGRSSFQLLQSFDMGQEKPPILFYAFDLLRLNGKNLQNLPIEERKAKLEELLKKPPGVVRYSVSFTKDIPELLDRAHKLGLEGDMSACRNRELSRWRLPPRARSSNRCSRSISKTTASKCRRTKA